MAHRERGADAAAAADRDHGHREALLTRAPAPLRAAAAGLLAALAALAAQKGGEWLAWVAGIGGIPFFLLFLVVIAPLTEETAKFLAARLFRVSWGAAGLSFGAWEAMAKLGFIPWHPALPLGALASLALHWGLGRMAARVSPPGYALAVAILLHAGFNLAGGGVLLSGGGLVLPALVTLLLGGALLWATRRKPLFSREGASISALTRNGWPP